VTIDSAEQWPATTGDRDQPDRLAECEADKLERTAAFPVAIHRADVLEPGRRRLAVRAVPVAHARVAGLAADRGDVDVAGVDHHAHDGLQIGAELRAQYVLPTVVGGLDECLVEDLIQVGVEHFGRVGERIDQRSQIVTARPRRRGGHSPDRKLAIPRRSGKRDCQVHVGHAPPRAPVSAPPTDALTG